MTSPTDPPRDAALQAVDGLRAAGHTAYLAGGCVRDALLGLTPKDYDVATDATPDRVQALFPRTAAVGAAFGVVLVYIPLATGGRHTIEVATFRAEGTYSDGRRPDTVRFTTAREDAMRRDFTVNGLFADPPPPDARSAQGASDTIIDYVGGQADLAAGVLRAIGDPDKRFEEDHLRMLRAVRFAARLGFTIEPDTAQAIRRHAAKLDGIARERIGDEVRRMMQMPPPRPATAAALLSDLGLTAVVLGHHKEIQPATRLPRLGPQAHYPTRLLAWFRDIGWEGTRAGEQARGQLMLSNDEAHALRATDQLCRAVARGWAGAGMALKKRWAADPAFAQAMLLLETQAPDTAQQIGDDTRALASDGVGIAPPPLITGDDLIAMGLRPGPNFKALLDQTYDAQLEGRVRGKDQALAFARDASA